MNFTFSIVMPSYKTDERTMRRALACVGKQTYRNYELIVIDDNDDNEFKTINNELMQEFVSENIRFLFHEKNKGANYARNYGINEAKGKYIAFLDADDEWLPSYLQSLKNEIDKGATFITANYQIVSPYGIQPPDFSTNKKYEGYIYEKMLLNDVVGPSSAVCVKTDELIKAGLFDVSLPARQDYDMWIRVAKYNSLNLVREVQMYIYRDGHDSISKSYKRNIKGTKMVMKKLYQQNFPFSTKKRIAASQNFQLGHICIVGNHQYEAIEYLWKSLMARFSLKTSIYLLVCLMPYSFKLIKKARRMFFKSPQKEK